MKVAIVLPRKFLFEFTQPNSIETVIRTFVRHKDADDEIAVFCDAGASDHGPVETITVAPQGRRYMRNRRIVAKLEDFKPDLIEVHQHVLSARQFKSALPNVPVVLYRHNSTKQPKNRLRRQMHRYRYRGCTGVIFVSNFLRDEFAQIFPEFADRTYSVQNKIEIDPWLAGVHDKPKTIAYGGRAAPEKGFAEICAALPTILERHPDWSLEMCAHDWNRHADWAEKQLGKLEGFGERFVLRKNQPLAEVQALLKRSAISLVPSVFEEPFGLAAMEAHVAGAAVVSSGRGGLREASGDYAEFIDDICADELVKALTNLIDNPEARLRLAEAGQQYVIDNHSADKGAVKLQKVRKTIVDGFSVAQSP